MKRFRILLFLLFCIIFSSIILYFFQRFSKANQTKANIVVNTTKIIGNVPENWKSLAQGGEEIGVQMLKNTIPQISELHPKYIRLDHIYDFYDVVQRDSQNNLVFYWEKLDATVCDIYRIGARPFFSLGYMPKVLSTDETPIGSPKNWEEWATVVQKTIEHYSGKSTVLCNSITGDWLTDIYYEVWNEPDLESFGNWSIYGGKDYKTFYYYSAKGAERAKNVQYFYLGGPATTSLYKNWVLTLLRYIDEKKLRIDFLSWHHYTKNPDDFLTDAENLDSWLSSEQVFYRFKSIPKIISEWGYDSNPNPVSETNVGAAYTIMSIRNLIDQNVNQAFTFEIKDGKNPTWGILRNSGEKKLRYHALRLLNNISGMRLSIEGEGTYVRGIASYKNNAIQVILVNYSGANSYSENVPVEFIRLFPGDYTFSKEYLTGEVFAPEKITVSTSLKKEILMPSNSVVLLKLEKMNLY